jgi:hypothetical protein
LTVVVCFRLEVDAPWYPTFFCIERLPGYPNLVVSSKAHRTNGPEVRPVYEIVCSGDPADTLLNETPNPRYLHYLAMANFGPRYRPIRVSQALDSSTTLTVEMTHIRDGMATVKVHRNSTPLAEAHYQVGEDSPPPKPQGNRAVRASL